MVDKRIDIPLSLQAHKIYLQDDHEGEHLDFECANLRNANLIGKDLSYGWLKKVNLQGANLTNAYLKYADLTGANLKNANLEGANLENTNLSGANLTGANLKNVNLKDTLLINTIFPDDFYILSIFKDIIYACKGYIRIGCEYESIKYWLKHYKLFTKKRRYTIKGTKNFYNFLKWYNEKGITK